MDPAMQEAALVRQIQSFKTSHELTEWKRKALADDAAHGLDDVARARVNREYKARLADLLIVETAGMI